MTPVQICDEGPDGFGWIAPEPVWMARTSHALAAGGRVWLVDPVDFDGLDERVRSLGEPAAVLQLVPWHRRDSARVARRLDVPLLLTPAAVPGSPFETVPVKGPPRWQETALWSPERRTLVVSEAIGTVRYYRAPGRAVGIHPFLRVWRPPAALAALEPGRILCGHGPGVHSGAAEALRSAIDAARRDLPRVVPRVLGARRHSSSESF